MLYFNRSEDGILVEKDATSTINYQVPGPNDCHISAILPLAILKRSKPMTLVGLSLAGIPKNSFFGVPVIVHRIKTSSPLDNVESCVILRSGIASLAAEAIFFTPSGPCAKSEGTFGFLQTKFSARIWSAADKSPF